MPSVNNDLVGALSAVRRPGDFYVAGRSDIFAPALTVDDVGVIALPLLPAQAERLAAIAERAPYGRGPETLVDTAVRRTWQIAAEHVHIGGRHWQQSLDGIVGRCAEGLGIQEPVRAELYKMLVYDTGSFFIGHRDTEKAPGMFATLVVVLPSQYTGGELRVRHREREVCLDLSGEDASEVAFAAFYADCWHEVRPVTSGCRLALIYNLIRPARGPLPQPPAYDAEIERATALLRRWADGKRSPGDDAPDKLIYPLEHIYTPAEIGFSRLKNADAAAARVLIAAAAQAGCELHLALVSIEESGIAEYGGYRRHRYRDDDEGIDGDFDAGEVTDRSLTLSDWRTPDDSPVALTRLPFDESELCPPDALADAEPDEQHFFEATGNAGASFERSYRCAAFVLWPRARRLELIAAAGQDVSLPYLADLARRWNPNQRGDQPCSAANAALRQDAQGLAMQIIAHWPAAERWSWPTQKAHVSSFLGAARRLQDDEAIVTLVTRVVAPGHYGPGANADLIAAIAPLPAASSAVLVGSVIARHATQELPACAQLLNLAAEHLPLETDATALTTLRQAASGLIAALPAPAGSFVHDRRPATPELVVDLLSALHRLDDLAGGTHVAKHLLATGNGYGLDTVLVPAALALATRTPGARNWPPIRDLTLACLQHLDARIAEPLAAPSDFARPSHVGCRCPHCTQLANFLADPKREQWIFKAAEALRSHVEDSIRRDRCDVDTETVRFGRPYELRCTKNEASYLRRVAQREEDVRTVALLRGATGG